MNAAWYLTGWTQVRITGAAPERVLAAMAERGLPFWDAAPPEDYALRLKTDPRTAKRLPALAASLGCEAAVVERRGPVRLLGRARRRMGLMLFSALALALLAASLPRIWSIEITGNETVPDGVILGALADCGVRIGASWLDMSQDRVRNAVLLQIPELRWMTVTMRGSRARVIVREKRPGVEPVPEREFAAVVSDKAGLVTEVTAKRGTAAAEVNRVILPGETIIEGFSTGRLGILGPVRAIGYARIRTWHEITAASPVSIEEKTYSGGEKRLFSLTVGNFRVNFYKDSSICPSECDKIIETYTIGAKGLFTLPVSAERTTLRPYGRRTERAEELPEELEALLMAELTARIGEDGVVRSYSFTLSEGEGVLYATLHAECEETAGETVPLIPEEIYEIQMKSCYTEEPDT